LPRNAVKRWLMAPGGVSTRYLRRTELCSFTVH
jgi:hypothetical protein